MPLVIAADVFLAADDKDNELVIKLHRLGRISFRQIKNKRDYLLHRKSASWLYVLLLRCLHDRRSRLAGISLASQR